MGKYKAFHLFAVFCLQTKRSWEWLRLKFRCIPGKKWCWSSMTRPTSLQNIRKAAITLPDSAFVGRIPGSICPNSITLQVVLLIKVHFTGQQLKAGLPLKDLCIFFWWGYCNVNFGMVEACLPLAAETRRCVHTESSWDVQKENQVWRSPTLSQKLLKTETHAVWKLGSRLLQA